MPFGHGAFCSFEDPVKTLSLGHFLSFNYPHLALHPKNLSGVLRGPLGSIERFEIVKCASIPPPRLSTWSSAFPTGNLADRHPAGCPTLDLSCYNPREEELSFTDDRYDALASCLLESFRVRKGGVVNTLSAVDADDSPENLVRRSEPRQVLRAEGPRCTPVQLSMNFLVVHHSDLQPSRSGRPIIQVWAELFQACPHETDPMIHF